MPVSGTVAPGFEAVAAAFEENLAWRGEAGASFCAHVGDRVVADLWGGEARPGVPWRPDTPVVVFSTTKGATTLIVAALAERGVLDLDSPVAAIWPGFAAEGKGRITVAQILDHTSGVIDFPGYVPVVADGGWWRDLDRVAASWETAVPAWEPGSAHGYHGASFGHLLGEIVRRATGETLGAAFRRLVADPLGLDVWIGLPSEHHHRVALLHDPAPPTDPTVAAYTSLFTPATLTGRAHLAGPDGFAHIGDTFNDPVLWSAEFPSGGGIATARGLAGMYAAVVNERVVSAPTAIRHRSERVRGMDLVLLYETRYGLGWQLPTEMTPLGPNDEAFGHGGLGGSLAFADPVAGVAAAYVMNRLVYPVPGETTRAGALVDALYGALR